jgi:hypothetical protein
MTDLTRQQLCAALSISESTVRRLERDGLPYSGDGLERRYNADTCKEWCRQFYAKPAPVPRPGSTAAFEGKVMRPTQFIRHAIKRVPGQPMTHGRHFGKSQEAVMPLLLEHIPGTRTKRWRETVLQEMGALPGAVDEAEDFRALVMGLSLVPDAFLINKDTAELHFFEVEVSSPMSRSKLQSYAKFLTDMHYYGIEFACFTVNQHGHINEVHLFPHYLDWLESQGETKHE